MQQKYCTKYCKHLVSHTQQLEAKELREKKYQSKYCRNTAVNILQKH